MKKELKGLEKKYKILEVSYLRRYKKLRDNSLLFSIIKISSNNRREILIKSKFRKESLLDFENNLENKYIREVDEPGYYCLTLYGIWMIEFNQNKINAEDFFVTLDKYYLDVFLGEKKINNKQKLQLFVLFSMRCFDKETFMDLKINDKVNDKWQDIVLKCYNFIITNDLIKDFDLKEKDIFGKQGADNKISNLFRHTDELPKSTKGVFNSLSKNQRYYLDVFEGNNFKKDNLSILINKIFGRIDYKSISNILEFSSNLLINNDFILFKSNNKFSSYKKTEEIKNIILNF